MNGSSGAVLPTPLQSLRLRIGLVATAITLGVLAQFAWRQWSPLRLDPPITKAVELTSPPIPPDKAATDNAIRFYTERVKRDPEDTRSQNALAEYYLQRVRETGNEDYLPMAISAARKSLDAVLAIRNMAGLTALAHAEFANHAFAAARDHALQLVQLDPTKSEPYAILGDASLELGDYEAAAVAFANMQKFGQENAGTKTRLARLAFLHGATGEARQHFKAALTLLLALPDPPNESILRLPFPTTSKPCGSFLLSIPWLHLATSIAWWDATKTPWSAMSWSNNSASIRARCTALHTIGTSRYSWQITA